MLCSFSCKMGVAGSDVAGWVLPPAGLHGRRPRHVLHVQRVPRVLGADGRAVVRARAPLAHLPLREGRVYAERPARRYVSCAHVRCENQNKRTHTLAISRNFKKNRVSVTYATEPAMLHDGSGSNQRVSAVSSSPASASEVSSFPIHS